MIFKSTTNMNCLWEALKMSTEQASKTNEFISHFSNLIQQLYSNFWYFWHILTLLMNMEKIWRPFSEQTISRHGSWGLTINTKHIVYFPFLKALPQKISKWFLYACTYVRVGESTTRSSSCWSPSLYFVPFLENGSCSIFVTHCSTCWALSVPIFNPNSTNYP